MPSFSSTRSFIRDTCGVSASVFERVKLPRLIGCGGAAGVGRRWGNAAERVVCAPCNLTRYRARSPCLSRSGLCMSVSWWGLSFRNGHSFVLDQHDDDLRRVELFTVAVANDTGVQYSLSGQSNVKEEVSSRWVETSLEMTLASDQKDALQAARSSLHGSRFGASVGWSIQAQSRVTGIHHICAFA